MSEPGNDTLAQLEAELAALHREWHSEQERYLIRGKDGQLREPEHGGKIAQPIAWMVGSVVLIAFAAALPVPPYVAWLGLVPFTIGTFRLLGRAMKSEAYERAHTAYESRRRQLLARIAAHRKQ